MTGEASDRERELEAEIGALVGEERLRAAGPDDAVDGARPRLVVEPGSADQLARVLALATARSLRVVPRGGGSKLGWGNPPVGADVLLSTRRLDRVVEHAASDMTVTVEAGCRLADLQRVLAGRGQRLAVDALWPEVATVGGLVATNDGGPLRTKFGAVRNHLLGVTVALADGTLARSGGRVVKNVAGYDLPKLMAGALGTLGVLVEATFRLYPLPPGVRDVRFEAPSPDAMNALVLRVADSTLDPTCVQVRAGSVTPLRVDVRFEGIEAALDDEERRVASLAGEARLVDPVPDGWRAFEGLWGAAESAAVCKACVPPASLGALVEAAERVASARRLDWRLVAMSDGVGTLRLEGGDAGALAAAVGELRAWAKPLGGSLAALGCAPELKAAVEVWGYDGTALGLMRRVKERFDPGSTLNPGRFVGRI